MAILDHIACTYAVLGQELTDAALAMLVTDLEPYDEGEVMIALKRCRTELRRITLADILDRMPSNHPGPEEAWSIFRPSLNNENLTIVWTGEMAEASKAAFLLKDDKIAARKAFLEVYEAAVASARASGKKPTWWVSEGYDKQGREMPIREAVSMGRLTEEQARKHIPDYSSWQPIGKLLDETIKKLDWK